MFGSLKFRHRIWLLVVVAGVALVTVTLVTLVLGRASQRQVAGVETRYVPLLELARDLEALYSAIPRAFEDAAAAGEEAGLDKARALTDELERRLRGGEAAIIANGGDVSAVIIDLRAYHGVAREVSGALVAGVPAEQLTDKIETMRRLQTTFAEHLDRATTPDRTKLTAAFAEARRSQSTALSIDVAVAAGGLALMGLLSFTLIRRMVRALQAVSTGMNQLAEGDFGHTIEVASRDELGELAREANRTAERLREARDRTEALLEQTRRQADELARANRYKSEFLANMSHELRTPLNSIMLLSKLLAENEGGELTAKHVEFATLIHRSGEELLTLINDVLDLAKIEAGKQTLVLEIVKLVDIADYARRMFAPVAAQKHLSFEVELADDVPREMRTDRVRLHQILKNLLSNAIKFTEHGKITMAVARTGEDDVEIAVIDTGIGIAEAHQAQIFEAFAQAEGGTSRKYGGTGLGLSIARQLAERLGGSLRVESKLGHGSTFRVCLPIGGPTDPRVLEDSFTPIPLPRTITPDRTRIDPERARSPLPFEVAPERDHSLEGKTVLVVDDDMRNVYSLTSLLHAKHMRVLTAADGIEALDELAAHPETSAVLVDIMMPRMDGHATIREIRKQAAFEKLPVMALTATTLPGERDAALASGADELLVKPLDVAKLVAWLRERLAGR